MNPSKQPAFIRLIFLAFSIFFSTAIMAAGAQNMTLILQSPDFVHQGEIPKTFTCDGNDSSPALSWSGLPQNTKSLVLIVDDPDAPDPAKPKMTWVHWLLYNIPPAVTELPLTPGSSICGTRPIVTHTAYFSTIFSNVPTKSSPY